MATVEMVGLPADGAGPSGQFHSTELDNYLRAVKMGVGVELASYSMTVTESNMIVTIPAFNAVIPDGSGSFVLVEHAGGNVTITAADATNPRLDIIVCDAAGALAATAGTPTAESSGTDATDDVDDVLGIVTEPPMPALASDEILLAKVYVGETVTVITAANVAGRAVHTDIYRWRQLMAWVADDAQNSDMDNELGSNNLPVGTWVDPPALHVTEAFNSDGTDTIAIGYDADTDAFGDETDVSSTGLKNMPAGTLEGYNSTARAVEAYYVNGGSEPTAGKAIAMLHYRFVPPVVS